MPMKRLFVLLLSCFTLAAAVSSCDVDDGLNVYATLQYETLGGITGTTETLSFNHLGSNLSEDDVRYIFHDMSADMVLRYGLLTLDIFEEVTENFVEQRQYEFQSDDGSTFIVSRLK